MIYPLAGTLKGKALPWCYRDEKQCGVSCEQEVEGKGERSEE